MTSDLNLVRLLLIFLFRTTRNANKINVTKGTVHTELNIDKVIHQFLHSHVCTTELNT